MTEILNQNYIVQCNELFLELIDVKFKIKYKGILNQSDSTMSYF